MLTKDNTKQQKGIAILLMIIHHLFILEERIPVGYKYITGITISNMDLIDICASFGKICVSMFMFLGGYGIFKSVVRNIDGSIVIKNDLAKRIVNLYCSYWKVFLVFIPIGFIWFDSCTVTCSNVDFGTRFSIFSFQEFVSNFFAWDISYSGEWWFFKTYLFTLFIGYVFMQLFKNRNQIYLELSVIILYHIIITNIYSIASSTPALHSLLGNVFFTNLVANNEYSVLFLVGILFAKYNIFSNWNMLIEKINIFEKIVLSTLLMIATVYLRVFIFPIAMDLLLVPIFIFATMLFINVTKVLKKPLLILGNNSTNMWLIHSFYCYYFYPIPKFIYGFEQPLISIAVLLIMSFISSILLDKFWNIIGIIYHKLSLTISWTQKIINKI